jgi:hypothetical protein
MRTYHYAGITKGVSGRAAYSIIERKGEKMEIEKAIENLEGTNMTAGNANGLEEPIKLAIDVLKKLDEGTLIELPCEKCISEHKVKEFYNTAL